jgi:hypothetical protein
MKLCCTALLWSWGCKRFALLRETLSPTEGVRPKRPRGSGVAAEEPAVYRQSLTLDFTKPRLSLRVLRTSHGACASACCEFVR